MGLDLQEAQGPKQISVIYYINDILTAELTKKHVATVLYLSDRNMSSNLTINPNKIQGLA